MTKEETLACSLSGPDMIERIREWGQVASRATSRHVEKGRIVSIYPPDQQLLQQLRELIAAEAECCPFMRFNVEEGPDEVEVELRVPDDMSEALAVMLGLVTQQSDPAPQAGSR
jgi:MerR family transcriptional regulator, copper efflux regulator